MLFYQGRELEVRTTSNNHILLFIFLVLVPKSPRQVEKTRKSSSQYSSEFLPKPVWPVSASSICAPRWYTVLETSLSPACRVSGATEFRPKTRGLFAEKFIPIYTWGNALSLLSSQLKPVSSCRYRFTAKQRGRHVISAASLASFHGEVNQASFKPVS